MDKILEKEFNRATKAVARYEKTFAKASKAWYKESFLHRKCEVDPFKYGFYDRQDQLVKKHHAYQDAACDYADACWWLTQIKRDMDA